MEAIKKYKSQFIFQILMNIAIVIFITFSSYYHLPLSGFKSYLIYAIHLGLLQFTIFGFTYWLTLNKWLFRILFPFLFTLLSFISFWGYTQDITVSESLIHATLDTKPDIALDLISYQLLIYLTCICLVVYFLLKKQSRIQYNTIKSPLTIFAIIGVVTFFWGENLKYGVFKYRSPYNVYEVVKGYNSKPKIQLDEIATQIEVATDSLNIAFVLGESVRADHLALNGYKRATTPLLSKQANLISFPNVYTDLTYTAVSVPQILTNQSIIHKDKIPKYSIYSVINKTSFETIWLGNQTPEKSYDGFINQNQKIEIIDPHRSVFSYHKKYDEELLNPFKTFFDSDKRQFFTIHMIGSHWWYDSRYPERFKKFTPTAISKHIASMSDEQMINSYDNTIVYLDYFLSQLISLLKKENTPVVLIYLSDHGEVLGEGGKWLHAQESEVTKNPAMLVWYSEAFEKKYPEKVKNLFANKNKEIYTDFLYHSVLHLIEVEGFEYDIDESIFN